MSDENVTRVDAQWRVLPCSPCQERQYPGFCRSLVRIGHEEGVKGLWRGAGAALLREASYSSIRMGLYEPLKLVRPTGAIFLLFLSCLGGFALSLGPVVRNPNPSTCGGGNGCGEGAGLDRRRRAQPLVDQSSSGLLGRHHRQRDCQSYGCGHDPHAGPRASPGSWHAHRRCVLRSSLAVSFVWWPHYESLCSCHLGTRQSCSGADSRLPLLSKAHHSGSTVGHWKHLPPSLEPKVCGACIAEWARQCSELPSSTPRRFPVTTTPSTCS